MRLSQSHGRAPVPAAGCAAPEDPGCPADVRRDRVSWTFQVATARGFTEDVVLCYGWIDGISKSLDAESYLQRYTPRRPKSIWSQINREHVARLTAEGRMTIHGQRQVDAAKADGRWDAAYAPVRSATPDSLPADLRAAIDASPRARATFESLGRMNLFALAFRTNAMKTAAGRERKIAQLVAMLERGETIVREPRDKPAG